MGRSRILVVEDEELVALAIKKCLEKLGYEVPDVVASGEEAVEKAASLQLDLVLMDIHLQGLMSGIEAAGHIRESQGVPVVYLSAYSDADTLSKAKITEPFGFIVKPFEERSLQATVEMALSRSEGQKELKGTHDTMSAVLDSIEDAIIATEPNGTIEYANDRARSLFRLPAFLPPSSSVLPLLKLIRTVTQETLSLHHDEVVTEGKSVRVPNCKLGHSDGSTDLLDVRLEPYQPAGRTTRGILLVFRGRESARAPATVPVSDKHGYENLIEKTERILHDAAVVQNSHEHSTPEQVAVPVGQELPSLRPVDARSVDGSVELRVSEDRMMAVANFYPPLGTGKPIVLIEVREQLIARGLRFGIDWDLVNSSIATSNGSHKALANVEIAHGRRPTDEVSSHIEIESSLLKKESPENPEALSVDFKAVSPFQVVKKGDVLARVVPRVDGVAGIDVTGVAVAYGKSADTSPHPGKNTLTQGDTMVAGCDGKFVTGEGSFWVSEVLEIPGDVDYSTGHIDFPGDVVVLGQIKQGFKVKAGGSLTCAKTIDASEISCGGDLVTEQGILGRAQSTVKVGGQIRAKFIENCTVEAGGDVFVSTGCLNSVVKALGSISTGPKGVIIGGRIFASKGVTAFQIGSSAGVRTEICCGEDYRIQQKLVWVKNKSAELTLKLKEVEVSLATKEKGNPRLTQMRDKLKNAILKMNESAKSLSASLHGNEAATIAAKGDLHHGVVVEICRVPFQVVKPMSGVRLVLDRNSRVITPEHLGKV